MRKPMFIFTTAVVAVAIGLLIAQRAPQTNMSSGALDELKFMVGEWEGRGWMEMRPGERHEMDVHEKIQMKVGGHALLVDGLGTMNVPGEDKPRVVHEALGVIWKEQGKIQFESWLADGRHGVHDVTFQDGVFVWRINIPQAGHIRYTIHINEKGQWNEIGERSMDEESWTKFFEMTLDRVKNTTQRDEA